MGKRKMKFWDIRIDSVTRSLSYKLERSDTTLRNSLFDILRFCGWLFPLP